MDAVEKKVENQVQFWSLLGPFFLLLSTGVLLFKVSPHWYFPLSAIIGIPLCVKWKMQGLTVALGVLLVLSGINYQNLELDERYWHVGLSLAIAFSFIVLTLALEEVQGVISQLLLESKSRLENFLILDDKWKIAEQSWTAEKEQVQATVAALSQELVKLREEKQTFYKLALLSKDELVHVRTHHEQLLKDLTHKNQYIVQLHDRLEESEITIQKFVDSNPEVQIRSLNSIVATLEQEKETLQAKITLSKNKESDLEKEIQEHRNLTTTRIAELEQETQVLKQQMAAVCAEKETCQREQESMERKCLQSEEEQHALTEKIAALQTELQTLQTSQESLVCDASIQSTGNTRQMTSMYAQLQKQFLEKSSMLDETRRELFCLNEKLLRYEKEEKEREWFGTTPVEEQLHKHILEVSKELEQTKRLYQQEIDSLMNLIEQLLKQIK